MTARVLVIDDAPANVKLLEARLSAEYFDVVTATSGAEGLAICDRAECDIVLLDVMMPDMDGFEVCRHLKSNPATHHIPVVMVTAVDDVGSAVRCIELGADDYLQKPVDPVLLAARINAGLTKKRLHDLQQRHVEEVDRLNRRLNARVEEQMAELVRTGELKRFMSNQVAEGLLAGSLSMDDGFERRKLTILFADMVGFTDLADTLEPEELAEVLNGYLREMAAVAVAHGGTLDNYMGDGVMVMFGAPERVDESVHAWSAVRAAFEMKERVEELSAHTRGQGIPADLRVRVGVNTGHCTVGVFGSDVLRAYTAVGFAVNVAARLQARADPGTVLAGFRTYALVKDRVEAEQRPPMTLKGAARPVEAWSLLAFEDGAGA